jgi:hypothetical protein
LIILPNITSVEQSTWDSYVCKSPYACFIKYNKGLCILAAQGSNTLPCRDSDYSSYCKIVLLLWAVCSGRLLVWPLRGRSDVALPPPFFPFHVWVWICGSPSRGPAHLHVGACSSFGARAVACLITYGAGSNDHVCLCLFWNSINCVCERFACHSVEFGCNSLLLAYWLFCLV